jgi:hypothetical protein
MNTKRTRRHVGRHVCSRVSIWRSIHAICEYAMEDMEAIDTADAEVIEMMALIASQAYEIAVEIDDNGEDYLVRICGASNANS